MNDRPKSQTAKTLPDRKRAPDVLRYIGTAQCLPTSGNTCWNFDSDRAANKLFKEIPKGIPRCPVVQDKNNERKDDMENKFIRADDVAQELNVSKPYAYKLIRRLNEELKAQGFITIAGRVNRQYFYERLYGEGKGEM